MSIRLHTLGRLSLERDGCAVGGDAVQPRRLALLALLSAAGSAGMPREKILGLLWEEHPAPRAILNEAVFVLRGALGRSAILSVGDFLHLNAEEAWSDAAAFQRHAREGRLEEAAALYGGPFLDGFYVRGAAELERWTAVERERLRREYGRVLERLAAAADAAGDTAAAAEWWGRLVAHEELSVAAARRYVEALVRAGEPVRAVQFGAEFDARVRRELGAEPATSILQYARSLARVEPPSRTGGAGGLLDGLPPELEAVGEIGRGSVARVYLAREPALGRQVAVKVLLPSLASEPKARARFEREAQAAARIDHPNVAPVFRTGRLSDGTPYLVMPYYHGGTLESRLRAAGPLSSAEARRCLAQLADGLAVAHALGIVHRDVRPANVLLHRDTDRVVLIDFGIAGALEAAPGAARLTLPGEALGTPTYASPEQLRGEPVVTDRADVYSLGILAFELLAGRPPFEGLPVEVMQAHALEVPSGLDELVPGIDPALARLVAACLAKRPEERPSAADVAKWMRR
jgi:DNA-binding SARP family transcriptional activator